MSDQGRRRPVGQKRVNSRHLVRSLLFLLALTALGLLFQEPLLDGFAANPYLNGTILAILGIGVLITLKGLFDVLGDARAVDRATNLVLDVQYETRTAEQMGEELFSMPPHGIASFLATVQRIVRQGNAAGTLPYLLDSLATRSEDRRAVVRYLTGALVLLGLIGTFYGLLITVGGVRDVISGLATEPSGETVALLSQLTGRLGAPLDGMAIAFSSSLFGLLASLALAFLELQLFHAQNDVHARLESLVVSDLVPVWEVSTLKSRASAPATSGYLTALMETAAERLDQVAGLLEAASERDARPSRTFEQLTVLAERIESLRQTLDSLERDRTADLRHELRLLTRTLSQGEVDRAAKA
jgi:hypothetical protein